MLVENFWLLKVLRSQRMAKTRTGVQLWTPAWIMVKRLDLSTYRLDIFLFVCSCDKSMLARPYVNSVPNNKFLDSSKLNAFADYKINLTEILKPVLEREEKYRWKRRKCIISILFVFILCLNPLPDDKF